MNTRSNKAKGRKGQQEVVKMLQEAFPKLHSEDFKSNPMGSHGEDVILSPAARKELPWNIEVKRKKKIGAARFMEQAAHHGDHEPVCFFREDRGTWYSCITAEYLLELISDGK